MVVRYCKSSLEGMYPGRSAIQAPKPLEEANPLPGVYHQVTHHRKGDRQGWGNESGPGGDWAEGNFAGREGASEKGSGKGDRDRRQQDRRSKGKDWDWGKKGGDRKEQSRGGDGKSPWGNSGDFKKPRDPCTLCLDVGREEQAKSHDLRMCFANPKGDAFKPLVWKLRATQLTEDGQSLPAQMGWEIGEKKLSQELGKQVKVDNAPGQKKTLPSP